jgi:hypothetical protein
MVLQPLCATCDQPAVSIGWLLSNVAATDSVQKSVFLFAGARLSANTENFDVILSHPIRAETVVVLCPPEEVQHLQ